MAKRSSAPKRSRTATPVHHLRATSNGLDSMGVVWALDDEAQTKMFSQGSASGPVSPIYEDKGELRVGTTLFLAFDYDADDYAKRDPRMHDRYETYNDQTKPGWPCEVVRVNVKTVTVKSLVTDELHRIFI